MYRTLLIFRVNERKQELTGNLPTVFVDISGHVAQLQVRVYESGWVGDNEPTERFMFDLSKPLSKVQFAAYEGYMAKLQETNPPREQTKGDCKPMCEICRRTPCHSHCPHAAEPVHKTCVILGCPIWEGMKYYESSKGAVCLDCLEDMTTKLRAPKNQFNKFGGYSYRNCEDILEAVKPLCKEFNATLIICDDIVVNGDRYYVKAKTTFTDCETGESIEGAAFAREEQDKKGMDGSQITGSASSYARKYALNGLFCIDDVSDEDAKGALQIGEMATEPEKKTIESICKKHGLDHKKVAQGNGFDWDALSRVQAGMFLNSLKNKFGDV
ncbi:ERF superfamily [Popillia japonica]|uniref:ERF superfamily n=1 Tax=Popillia japonica TaxID=7064 RepID=A0AAW1HSD0_POPJA